MSLIVTTRFDILDTLMSYANTYVTTTHSYYIRIIPKVKRSRTEMATTTTSNDNFDIT